jgi:hypothetical protein
MGLQSALERLERKLGLGERKVLLLEIRQDEDEDEARLLLMAEAGIKPSDDVSWLIITG